VRPGKIVYEVAWQHTTLSVGQQADRPETERLRGMTLVSDAMGRTTQFEMTEVNTSVNAIGKKMLASLGSVTMPCLTI
jgi:hypothetical protein